ncbi:MAG: hypothetical protein IJU07_06550 [Synergistaceae bacterium]|nr:hypothetical protein [Synergistaceae bacterium]
MEEQGKIISSCDIDSNLALQIWTRGKTPRLSILNKAKNSRKLIHIAWIEKRSRTLSIGGKKSGENISYNVGDFEPAISKILTEYFARTNFKIKYFKLVIDLEKAIHHPEPVSSKSDFAMMTEDKRSSLWIADCSAGDRNSGYFRPFFPYSTEEAQVLTEDRLQFNSIQMRGTEGLFRTGVIDALKEVNPERWHNTVRVTAAAMMLGFSYCGADGSKMADTLWSAGEKPKNLNPNVTVMKIPEKKISINDPELLRLGHKFTAFIRHYYRIDDVKVSYCDDSEKELHGAGFNRNRRIDFNTGTLGDVPYRVTFYENPDTGMTAFGCNPRMQTARHTGDMVIMIPTEMFKAAMNDDIIGSSSVNEFYTITRLLWAKQFRAWYENIKPYVRKFAGLIEK